MSFVEEIVEILENEFDVSEEQASRAVNFWGD